MVLHTERIRSSGRGLERFVSMLPQTLFQATVPPPPTSSYPVINGLHWAVAFLCRTAPLVLTDDLFLL